MTAANFIGGSGNTQLFQKVYTEIIDNNGNVIGTTNPIPVKISDGTNTAIVDNDGQLHTVMQGKIDDNNATTATLLAGATFTGTATDISAYSAISLLVESDVASTASGLTVQFSATGNVTDWHDGESYTIPAGSTKFFTPPVQSKYYRIVYTNGASDQSSFHLHPMLKKQPIKWSSHNLQDNLNDADDGELNLSVLKLRTAANNYVSGAATNSGNFKVSVEEFESSANPVRTDMEGGGKVSVGTSAVEMTFTGETNSIILTADTDNTGVLYVGKSDVDNTGANAIAFLESGDNIVLSYNDSDNALYVVSDTASQNVWKGSLL